VFLMPAAGIIDNSLADLVTANSKRPIALINVVSISP
jgi:hypothetical protein